MKKAVVFTTLLMTILAVADWLNPVRAGLNATYYANANWSGAPVVSTIDPQPSDDRLLDAWRGAPPPQFSTTWAGSFLTMHDGPYALATISDDDSSVYVDGQIAVDNAGRRVWPRGATGVVTLTRGVHAIYVRYAQDGGPFHLELLWARAGQPLERLPAWALTPRRVNFWAFALSAGLKRSLAAAEWVWVCSIVVWALTVIWLWLRKGRAWLQREEVWPALKWILAGSLVLNTACIWWGLPGGSWAPDELTPTVVLGAAARGFAHGWFDRYPPFHFYVLTVASSPLIVLEWLGRVDLSTATPFTLLVVISRLISIAAGLGTLLAIYAAGARIFGRRAGVLASAMFALVAPFVYYAKTANLDAPYLFWFAVSLVFYLRLLQGLAPRDFVGFAVCATLAICTKDQAYALYLLMPFAFVERVWRANRDAGERRPLMRALVDRRLLSAAAVAIVLFVGVHNIAFNLDGFRQHVLLITGPASESYRDFEPTIAGRVALLRLTVDIIRNAWGWPMFLTSVSGVVFALLTPALRGPAIWLLLPIVSYYAGFIDVVLYNYDRFMLPVCLVLSLFGGLALDRCLAPGGRARTWRRVVAGTAFAYSLLFAATVDLAMMRDSRYTVEVWLAAHVAPGEAIGSVFPQQYYPRLDRFTHAEITSANDLREGQPSYYVLNADYARAEPADSEIGRLIAGLQDGRLGYGLVFQYRQPAPWPWLPGAPRDLVGDRNERPITSVLRHINPRYEVFKRGSQQSSPAAAPQR
jgi:PA14 domain-containing protein/dolichyl-phosphate-mannose-protein mannosyltransferase